MEEKKKITVKLGSEYFRTTQQMLILLVSLLAIISIILIVSGTNPFACLSFVLCVLPFYIATKRLKKYKIEVYGNNITVTKGNGKEYNIDVSDIVQVKWIQVSNKFTNAAIPTGRGNENIIIKTKSIRFTVETLMEGFENMSRYITENVDSSKIKVIRYGKQPTD